MDGQAFYEFSLAGIRAASIVQQQIVAAEADFGHLHRGDVVEAHRGLLHLPPEEDHLLIDLKETQARLPRPEIHQRFNEASPGQRSQGSQQVHYGKLKRRKETEPAVTVPYEVQLAERLRRSSRIIQYSCDGDSDDLDEPGDGTEDDDCFPVEHVLAWAESGDFLVLWSEGTTTWDPTSHFQDQKSLEAFEKTYRGYDDGIDILDTKNRIWDSPMSATLAEPPKY